MRIAAFVGLLAVMLGGCAANRAEHRADWRGDVRFSADERAAIETGEAWLAMHAGQEPATFDWTYEAGGAREAQTIRRERGRPDAAGLCERGTVYIDPIGLPNEGMRPEYLPGLAAHEFAHCELGFVDGYHAGEAHTDGIMRVLYPMRWTEAEDAQLAER